MKKQTKKCSRGSGLWILLGLRPMEFGGKGKRKEGRTMVSLFLLGCLVLLSGISGYIALTQGRGDQGFFTEQGYLFKKTFYSYFM